jgi:hypothetical protein
VLARPERVPIAPLVACPALLTPRRPFSPDREAVRFDFERVELYGADWRWLRTVDQLGRISLADDPVSVGQAVMHLLVAVTYDGSVPALVAHALDEAPPRLAQFSLPVVSPAYLLGSAINLMAARGR